MRLLAKTRSDYPDSPDQIVRKAVSFAVSAPWRERVEVTALFPGRGGNRGRMVSITLPDEATARELQELRRSLESDPRLEYVELPARKRLIGVA